MAVSYPDKPGVSRYFDTYRASLYIMNSQGGQMLYLSDVLQINILT